MGSRLQEQHSWQDRETQFAWDTFVSPGLRVLDSGQVTYNLCLARHEAHSIPAVISYVPW